MSSLRQIEANRRNAQKSTGPRSVEGQAASSRNALKSGIDAKSQILPGEKVGDLELLTAEYYDRYRPATPETRHLVDTLISNEWILRRFRRIETQVMGNAMEDAGSYLDKKNPLGDAYRRCERSLDRLQRRINAAERNYHRALKELETLSPEIGFVPQPAPDPEPAEPSAIPAVPVTAVPRHEHNPDTTPSP